MRSTLNQLASAASRSSRATGSALQSFFDLLIPHAWTAYVLESFLNSESSSVQERSPELYIDISLEGLRAIELTAALVAGVISSAFSWYNIEQTNWATKSLWLSGFVLALFSIAIAGVHLAALLRLKMRLGGDDSTRRVFGEKVIDRTPSSSPPLNERWQPRVLMPYVLEGPAMHLKLSVTCVLAGLIVELWRSALQSSLLWRGDELKIAFIVTSVTLFALVNYVLSVSKLFYTTIQ